MNRSLLAAVLAAALAPGLGCLSYNDPCQPLVANPDARARHSGRGRVPGPALRPARQPRPGADGRRRLLHAEDDSQARAELGIVNGGAIRAEGLCITRTSLPKGPLTDGVFREVLLFENRSGHGERHREATGGHDRALGERPHPRRGSPSPPRLAASCTCPRAPRCVWTVSAPGASASCRADAWAATGAAAARTDVVARYRVATPSFLLEGGDGYGPIFANASAIPRATRCAPASWVAWTQHRGGLHEGEPTRRRRGPSRSRRRIVFENCAMPPGPRAEGRCGQSPLGLGLAVGGRGGHRSRGRHGATAAGLGGGDSTSLTDGILRMSPRATFQACWTIQDSERSWRVASRWISSSMSSGK